MLYRSGQLLDIERLAAAARERGIVAGFDCAHSAGAVPHRFDEWGVDFAFWCTYKYLNGGPGSVGALYVNRRHFGARPGLSGWWGYHKEQQFDMVHEWEGAPGRGRLADQHHAALLRRLAARLARHLRRGRHRRDPREIAGR